MTSAASPTPSPKNSISNQGGLIAKQPLGSRLSVQRDAIFILLNQLAIENETYFRQSNSSSYNARIADICEEISASLDLIKAMVIRIQIASHKCDYDENTPGNGFRSLVCVSDVVLLRLVSILRMCSENRFTLMFRLSHYCKELESFGAILRFLILTFQQVIVMLDPLDEGSLFPSLDGDYQKYNVLMKSIENLDATCFYGRPIGFQFCPSVTRIFRIIGLVLATYSLSWESKTASWGTLLNSGKLLLNPEQRAKRIVKVIREADIGFCRGFWNLSELPMPKLFCPSMAICESREIQPIGPISLETTDGSFVQVKEPSSHTGVRPVSIKILSYSNRVGLSSYNFPTTLPSSPHIVIHCHGGGYVATSSKSHETYLRLWAKSLNCPIVSVDYSLAPENPFPRPTEEVLYAYAYILKNPEKFGWTGEKVCMVGDSAGGNLITSVCLLLVQMNAKRLPDGIVPIYTPFLFQYLPSPSRVLSFMDPLLHMGVVIRCAAAYTGLYSDDELDKNCTFHSASVAAPNNGHRSLADYVEQVQRAHRGSILDLTQGSQSIVSLINLSFMSQAEMEMKANKSILQNEQSEELDSSSKSVQMEEVNDENFVEAPKCDGNEEKAKSEVVQGVVQNEAQQAVEEEEDDSVEEIQSVRVDGDPSHICLSATNFDHTLIEFLQVHPLTRDFVQQLDPDTNGEELTNQPQIINFGGEEVFDNNAEELSENGSKSANSSDKIADKSDCSDKSNSDKSDATHKSSKIVSFCEKKPEIVVDELPIHCDVLTTPEHKKNKDADGKSAAKIDPDSSVGHTPFFKSAATENFLSPDSDKPRSSAGHTPFYHKTPLSRNKCRSWSQSFSDTAALAAGHAFDNISDWFDTPTKEPVGHSDKKKLTRATTMSTQKAARLQQEESMNHESHFTELLKLNLPRNFLMSPMYAPDDILEKLPPMRFVACHLDPLLDDTITFAKKLRSAGGKVVSIDMIDSLPHGFLNFSPMSHECREGANLCLERVRETLEM